MQLFIGTYTENARQGIEVQKIDSDGYLRREYILPGIANPSYLVFSRDKNQLFCVNETDNYRGEFQGALSSFSVSESGKLNPINSVPSAGAAPCFINLDRSGTRLLVANYLRGTVALFPIHNREILPASSTVRHFGNGPVTERQEDAHLHCIVPCPWDNSLFAADLGSDRLYRYVCNDSGILTHRDTINLPAGSGPRNLLFSKNQKMLYVVNELNNTLSVFSLNNQNQPQLVQSVLCTDGPTQVINYPGEARLSADERHLYVSNRGKNSISVFSVLPNGLLEHIQSIDCHGIWPRAFILDSANNKLYIANQKSMNITQMDIMDNGCLKFCQTSRTHAPPACIVLRP